MLIGYLSGTKYGIIGGVRLILGELSLDMTVMLLNALLLLSFGGYDYETIVGAQFDVGGLAVLGIVFSIVYIIQMFLTAQRAPLDLIENEGELVAGYNTEFSGPDVLVIYFAEYLHIFNGVLQFVYLMFGLSIVIFGGTEVIFVFDYAIIPEYVDYLYMTPATTTLQRCLNFIGIRHRANI